MFTIATSPDGWVVIAKPDVAPGLYVRATSHGPFASEAEAKAKVAELEAQQAKRDADYGFNRPHA